MSMDVVLVSVVIVKAFLQMNLNLALLYAPQV